VGLTGVLIAVEREDDVTDGLQWLVRFGDKVRGPYDLGELKQLRKRGELGRFHLVSLDGADWGKAMDLPGVFTSSESETERSSIEPAPRKDKVAAPSAEPVPPRGADADDALAPRWYYPSPDGEDGPVSVQKLKELHERGVIRDEDWVKHSESGVAVAVADLKARGFASPPGGLAEARREKTAPWSLVAVSAMTMGIFSGFAAIPLLRSTGPLPKIFVPSIAVLAIVLGATGLRRFRRRREILRGFSMTLSGLLLGLFILVVSVVVIVSRE